MSTSTATAPVAEKPIPAAAPLSEPASAPEPEPKTAAGWQRFKKPAMIAGAIVAAIAIAFYAYDALTHEETDDAYVTGHLHEVASRINGMVTAVQVEDNQRVREGDVLVELDPSEYVALAAAAKANLTKAQADLDREEPLLKLHAYSQQDIDAAKSTRDVDLAQYELAELQIQYSTIHAPADGYVGRKNVEVGDRVSSGQTLLDVVEPDVWVVGNFKETQLAKMRVGQPVRITIDSLPGKVFTGTVQSFAPATGNEFALLPADNSTGNFTKIVFDPASIRGYETRIRAGESAEVKVALVDPDKARAR